MIFLVMYSSRSCGQAGVMSLHVRKLQLFLEESKNQNIHITLVMDWSLTLENEKGLALKLINQLRVWPKKKQGTGPWRSFSYCELKISEELSCNDKFCFLWQNN